VAVAERFADGNATESELAEAFQEGTAVYRVFVGSRLNGEQRNDWPAEDLTAATLANSCGNPDVRWWLGVIEKYHEGRAEFARQVTLLRDIFGNPFRPITIEAAWQTANVVALAQAIYDERAFDRMPILGDALEDAGCTNANMLMHCRQPGEHVRGCWVVDLVLGKD
jgi:hypothetical protein